MNNVMVDLETLGTVPGCTILSIGAVYFDRHGLGATFYTVVSRAHCMKMGLKEDKETIAWWDKQSAQARQVLEDSEKPDAPSLHEALEQFRLFLRKETNVKVWGNGADFDNPILACGYAAIELRQAWSSWNGRCYRTLKSIAPGQKLVRVGTFHHALDDAKSQAQHAIEIFRAYPALVL